MNLVTVHFWFPLGGNIGHASLQVGKSVDESCEYISWWPSTPISSTRKVAGTGSNLADDEYSEGRHADVVMEINGLDTKAICLWWSRFRSEQPNYGLAGRNCCWAIVEALRAGGSDRLFPWYRFAVKKNIPIDNIMRVMATAGLRDLLLGTHFLTPVTAASTALRYWRGLPKRKADYGKSHKSFDLAAGDAFSNVWSPQDALAYCLVVKENAERFRIGKSLWQPAEPDEGGSDIAGH